MQAPLSRLRDAGVTVSTVGIGNPEPTPIAANEDGQCVNESIEVNGERVLIPLRADILKYIATEGAGAYYSETESGQLADALRDDRKPALIDETDAALATRDVSGWFVTIATLALLGFVFAPVRFPDESIVRE